MHSECPHCKAVFRVTPRQLAVAKGMVRCGQCQGVFNAAKSLKPQQPAVIQREAAAAKRPTIADLVASAERAGQRTQPASPSGSVIEQRLSDIEDKFEQNTFASGEETTTTSDDIRSAARQLALDVTTGDDEELPEFSAGDRDEDIPNLLIEDLQPKVRFRRYSRRATAMWGIGILGLILLLVGQYVYRESDGLKRYPQLHSKLVSACKFLPCTAEPLADTNKIELLSRNIYSHPNQEDALMIVATMVNRAEFAQPFPMVQVSLTNVQGRIVASRRFRPEEYVPELQANQDGLMEPGTPINIGLEVADPGSNAMAFQFDFIN